MINSTNLCRLLSNFTVKKITIITCQTSALRCSGMVRHLQIFLIVPKSQLSTSAVSRSVTLWKEIFDNNLAIVQYMYFFNTLDQFKKCLWSVCTGWWKSHKSKFIFLYQWPHSVIYWQTPVQKVTYSQCTTMVYQLPLNKKIYIFKIWQWIPVILLMQ